MCHFTNALFVPRAAFSHMPSVGRAENAMKSSRRFEFFQRRYALESSKENNCIFHEYAENNMWRNLF